MCVSGATQDSLMCRHLIPERQKGRVDGDATMVERAQARGSADEIEARLNA